jgi:DNA-binding IclR family transcriptional regulator
MGRVLLAAKDDRTIDRYLAHERLVKFTPLTVTSKTQLRRLFRDARQWGYSVSDQEMDIGATGVAAAIQNVAAISSRHDNVGMVLAPVVKAFATKISAKLGYVEKRAGS